MNGILTKTATALLLGAFFAGCIYKGAKCTEGMDVSVGISVPGTEGAASLTILNYLSGFRLGVAENAALKVKYTVAETNDYFGVVHIRSHKTIDAKVEPCETTPPNEQENKEER